MVFRTGPLWALRIAAASSALALAATIPALGEPAISNDGAALAPAAVAAADPQAAVPAQPDREQLAPSETPVPVATTPPPSPAEPHPVVTAAPVPVSDPVLVAVRDQLARAPASAGKADIAALAAFYATRTDGPLWVKGGAFTAPATAIMTALGNAGDWGLDAKSFPLPQLAPGSSPEAQAAAEVALGLSALKYAHQASGGRIDPSTLSRFNDERGTFADPSAVITALATSAKPDETLEVLHPKHEQFQRLHAALVKLRHGDAPKAEPAAIEPPHLSLGSGPPLKPGAEHPDIATIRTHFGIPAASGKEAVYDALLAGAVKSFQADHDLKANGVINAATRQALNGGEARKTRKAPAVADTAQEIDRIALNMERWRWLPADMGVFHIENNIPEYQTRVFQEGKLVHQEKIIVGKTDTPTPVFSANMQFVIFHPEWGVPDGIKVKEIWPYLRRAPEFDFFGGGGGVSDISILKRHNLRVSYNGRPVDASQIDWTKADPRAYQFIQPAGGQNVLGVVKFRFPNRHDVYMHDTPQRELFSQSARAISHGCMRVHNPERLAAVILAWDRGWSADKVSGMIAGSGTTEVKLEKPFPVHVTYFTARVEDDGKLTTFADLYGHDAKLAAALAGHPVHLEDPSTSSGSDSIAEGGRKPQRIARKGVPSPQADAGLGGLLSGLFGN